MKLVPFFFAFFLPSPEWEAFRRVIKNAKTNNKASHNGRPFLITERQHYDIGKPIAGAAR
jgi:hypothetical protein